MSVSGMGLGVEGGGGRREEESIFASPPFTLGLVNKREKESIFPSHPITLGLVNQYLELVESILPAPPFTLYPCTMQCNVHILLDIIYILFKFKYFELIFK